MRCCPKKNLDESYGRSGELKVQYVLKWIEKKGYCLINNGDCINIENPQYIEFKQQIDHIIIGKQGVFNIESKSFSGKITIDENGRRYQDKLRFGIVDKNIVNPVFQIDRHHNLLESIIGNTIPIIDIICIASDKTQIIGAKNCAIPVVRLDELERYILNYKSEKILSQDEINQVAEMIESHLVD